MRSDAGQRLIGSLSRRQSRHGVYPVGLTAVATHTRDPGPGRGSCRQCRAATFGEKSRYGEGRATPVDFYEVVITNARKRTVHPGARVADELASVLRLQPAGCPLCKRAPLNGRTPRDHWPRAVSVGL